MRTDLEQLVDMQNAIIKGMREIRRRRLLKYAYPIVLEGAEGVILRDLLELIAASDRDYDRKYHGTIYFEKSPVLCSREFPLPGSIGPPVSRL